MLVIFIGGSHAGNLIPSSPIPRAGWEEVIEIGPSDLNLKAFCKPYESYDDVNTYKVTDGKSTFVSIVALRGVDKRRPVIDSGADKDVMSGREGAARAPSVQTEDDGIVIASYVYDDPQVGKIMSRHDFNMILSTDTRSGDGMAIGVKSTRDGESGNVYAEGQWQPGGGNEIGMAISFRPENGDSQYYSADNVVPDTPRPTDMPSPAPTGNPTSNPTKSPTDAPVVVVAPSPELAVVVTDSPTKSPSGSPTSLPTQAPTQMPSASPTLSPTDPHSLKPTVLSTTNAQTTSTSGSSSADEESHYGGGEEGEEDVVDISEPDIVPGDATTPETASSTQIQQNSSDNGPLLIGVIVGMTVFSVAILAAAIKYRRDALRDALPAGEFPKPPAKRSAPIRSDTYVSEASDSDEPPRSWTAWVSEVDSELSVIEEGRVVCDDLGSTELIGFEQFVPRSSSPPPPPPPPRTDGI